jgi:hypothetical protein
MTKEAELKRRVVEEGEEAKLNFSVAEEEDVELHFPVAEMNP